jgi:hypothetical protein
MDNITDSFANLSIQKKQCLICNKLYDSPYYYHINNVLCIICSNNYNEYLSENNNNNIFT